MHIKNIIIHGFKAIRNLSFDGTFHPGHNVIIGANGDGKSTIFDAIRFALSDGPAVAANGTRAGLLWQDTGGRATKADVTIVFDNTDRRLSTTSLAGTRDEVTVRRVVGSKKDEHFINGRSVSRSDVQSLLEAAGFSRHNPYFMVEQGKVTDLSVMRDDARMELLKRVAGTDVYEHRRKEALRILAETERKRQGIDEVVAGIDERLRELEEERAELEEYRRLDTERRALQYTLHQRQLEATATEMADSDDRLAAARVELEEQQRRLDEMRSASAAALRRLHEAEGECSALRSRKEDLELARREAASAVVRTTEELRALEQDVAADSKTEGERQAELAEAEKALAEAEALVHSEHDPAVAAADAAQQEASQALRRIVAREDALLARQGRSAQFSSAAKRDKWLRERIAEAEAAAEAQAARGMASRERAEQLRTDAAASRATAATQDKTAEELAKSVAQDLEPRLRAARKDAQRAGRERGAAMADLSAIERDRAAAEARQLSAEKRLYRGVPAAVRQGLAEASRLVTEEGLAGVHGPLMELVTYAPQLDVAVQEVAGKQLFNLVVDDEHVAARIVRHLQRSGKGRVTCMPLARLRPRGPRDFDERAHPDVTPLSSQLTFHPSVQNAVLEVFGSVLVCKDADTARKYALPPSEGGMGMDCVTTDGYRRNADGSIFGGYVDRSATRSGAERERRAAGEELAEATKAAAVAMAAAGELERRLAKLRSEDVELANEAREATSRAKQLRLDAEASRRRAASEEERAAAAEREAVAEEASVEEARASAAGLREELGTPLSSTLSAPERAELTACSREREAAQAAQREATIALEERRAARDEVTSDIEGRLRPSVEHLRAQLSGSAGGTGGADVESRRARLQETKAELDAATARQRDAEAQLKECLEELAEREAPAEEAQSELERQRAEEQTQAEQLKRLQGGSEALWRRHSQAAETRRECEAKLRDLGTLPSEAMSAIASLSRSEVMRRLKTAGKKLAKFGHVNKKALRQWETFSDQRTALEARRLECETGAGAIQATIRHLDTEKDKAILRTFRGVAMHFRKVFNELVPHGKASMVLVAEADGAADAGAKAAGAARSLGPSQSEGGSSSSSSSSASASAAAAVRRSASSSREIESDSQELTELEARVVAGPSAPRSRTKRTRGGRATRRGEPAEDSAEEKVGDSPDSDSGSGSDDEPADGSGPLASQSASVSSIASRRSELDVFKGVAVKASFADGEAPKRVELYSGGQKTMLAIALLLAIQRCDPAPFYLFDEVDQALDSTYRTALAEVIKRQAASTENPAQFLTISFRTEVIAAADAHFVLVPGHNTQLVPHSASSALVEAERICEEEAARARRPGSERRRSRSRSRSVAGTPRSAAAGAAAASAEGASSSSSSAAKASVPTPSRTSGRRARGRTDSDDDDDDDAGSM